MARARIQERKEEEQSGYFVLDHSKTEVEIVRHNTKGLKGQINGEKREEILKVIEEDAFQEMIKSGKTNQGRSPNLGKDGWFHIDFVDKGNFAIEIQYASPDNSTIATLHYAPQSLLNHAFNLNTPACNYKSSMDTLANEKLRKKNGLSKNSKAYFDFINNHPNENVFMHGTMSLSNSIDNIVKEVRRL